MAIQAYLKFETAPNSPAAPIVGESLDKTHRGWIELTEFSFGLENPLVIGSRAGGAGAGKTEFKKLVIRKMLDSTTPGLMQTLCTGAHYATATLNIVNVTSDLKAPTKPLAQFEMKMVMISDIEFSGSAGDSWAAENVTIQFGALKVTCNPQAAAKGAKPQEAVWSTVLNTQKFEVV